MALSSNDSNFSGLTSGARPAPSSSGVGSASMLSERIGRVAGGQFKDVGVLVPADVQVAGGFGEKGAHGKKRRALGMGQLKLARRFSVHRETRAINGLNRAGKIDGGDAVGGDRHGHHHMIIEPGLLNGG